MKFGRLWYCKACKRHGMSPWTCSVCGIGMDAGFDLDCEACTAWAFAEERVAPWRRDPVVVSREILVHAGIRVPLVQHTYGVVAELRRELEALP